MPLTFSSKLLINMLGWLGQWAMKALWYGIRDCLLNWPLIKTQGLTRQTAIIYLAELLPTQILQCDLLASLKSRYTLWYSFNLSFPNICFISWHTEITIFVWHSGTNGNWTKRRKLFEARGNWSRTLATSRAKRKFSDTSKNPLMSWDAMS